MEKTGYIYILSNRGDTVLYTGVTSNLVKRIWEHKNKVVEGFSKKYNLTKLVYYEIHDDFEVALNREKEIKAWRREKKVNLIKNLNPTWKDLYSEIIT